MRWEALFADLAGQWDAALRAADESLVADLAETEMGQTLLADRLRAKRSEPLTVRLSDGSEHAGVVVDASPHWLLLGSGLRRVLIPVAAVAAAWPLGPVAPPAGAVESRLGIGHLLRAIAREGAVVRVSAAGFEVRGSIVRVGADHLDVRPGDASAGGAPPVSIALARLLSVASG